MSDSPCIREYVALDLETTGLDPATDRVVEIGAVRFRPDGSVVDRFATLVNPRRPIPERVQRIHGISDRHVRHAPGIETALPTFFAWASIDDGAGVAWMAHNARFDAGFLAAEARRIGRGGLDRHLLDTLALARKRLPHLTRHSLDRLTPALGLDASDPHRAGADSERVRLLWLALGGAVEDCAAYSLSAAGVAGAPPVGYEDLRGAIAGGWVIRMEYAGGTHGSALREATPLRIEYRGGRPCLVAICHVDRLEKTFRLDRVIRYEVRKPVDA